MSRSNPTLNQPHPCTRWYEWNGETGVVRYYDKAKKENVEVGDDFTFIMLDELATIKGWHEKSKSGIHSNEVRDTRAQPFVVKAFQGGTLAEGIYQNIKDRVAVVGGKFTANLYIAYKDGKELKIGSIQFSGAALGEWMDFRKANRADLYNKAVRIKGSTEGKKGKITFHTPKFHLTDVTGPTNEAAIELDKEVQAYLEGYFSRKTTEQASTTKETHPHDEDDAANDDGPPPGHRRRDPDLDDTASEDDIPF